jgi:hypothetical protein
MNRIIKALFLCGLAATSGLGSPACNAESSPRFGSETHFLSRCRSDDACTEGLVCLCGACTLLCDEGDDCSGGPEGLTCQPRSTRPLSQSCGDTDVEATCDVRCGEDEDCAGLSGEYQCDRGLCRLRSEKCGEVNYSANDFIVLGDRFLANSGEVVFELEQLMIGAGVLSTEETLRNYSSGVVSPFGAADDLFSQYENAKADGPSKVVVLNAGGPDALLTCDVSAAELCPTLQTAKDGTSNLFTAFAEDGVQEVILFFYPRPSDEVLAAKFDLLQAELEEVCDDSTLACSFLPLKPLYEERHDTLLTGMGLFPTADGAIVAAGAIFGAMQSACIVP